MPLMTQTFAHGYALLIGVGQCLDSRFSLHVTVKDMQALRQILVHPDLCAYPDNDQHVRLLHDQGATRSAILEGLVWLKERAAADPKATVILYYSGHGWLETTTGQYFLIPHEFNAYDWRNTALNAKEFNQAIHQIPAQRRLVILDCCHAAGMATAKESEPEPNLPRGVTPTAEPKGLIDALKQGEGRVVFTSCRGEQKSWIRADHTLSVYTHHLIEALQGAASPPGATEVTVFDLANHLSKAVPESARAMGNEQNPRFEMAETERFAIALLQGGKGLPTGGWDAVKPQANVPPSSVQASGQRSVAIRGNVNGGTIITGDQNQVNSSNTSQHGNIFHIHAPSNFSIGDSVSPDLTKDAAVKGQQRYGSNLSSENAEARNSKYVERKTIEIRAYKKVLKSGAALRITGSRYMGKTSLIERIICHAEQRGCMATRLTCRRLEEPRANNLDSVLQWLCTSMNQNLKKSIPIADFWSETGCMDACSIYFEEHLLNVIDKPLLLCLDDVDLLFKYPEVTENFLNLLRSWHEDAKIRPTLQRLRLVVAYTGSPPITGTHCSPFDNLGELIALKEFTEDDIHRLVRQHQLSWISKDIRELISLTTGHPYLVKEALDYCICNDISVQDFLLDPMRSDGYQHHLNWHWKNLEQNEFLEDFRKVVFASQSVQIRDAQVREKLSEFGLVKISPDGGVVPHNRLSCEYFRKRFGS
jgi:hypothetical protein